MLYIHFEPALLLQLLASTVFPLLVGLVTTRDTHPGRRAVLLAALSVATSLAAELAVAIQSGRPYDLIAGLLTALTSFLVAVGLHFGLWNPIGAAALVQGIGSGPRPAPAAVAPAAHASGGSLLQQAQSEAAASNVFVHVFPPAGADQGAVADSVATAVQVAAPAAAVVAPIIHDPAEGFNDPARPPA